MQLLMKLMQFSIVVAVVGSNIEYGWTPNGLVAGIVALACALLATAIIMESLRLYRWVLRTLKRFDQQ